MDTSTIQERIIISLKKQLVIIFAPLLCWGCTTTSVKDTKGSTVSEAQAVSATGPKARIVVAQFVNNTGGWEAQMQRSSARRQAEMQNLARDSMEFQKRMIPYYQAMAEWQAKVASVGEEKAVPHPEAPEFPATSSSPYMAVVTDPIAGGLRDMMINALFNSRKFIVLERQSIDKINWEGEFYQSARVGSKTKIPVDQIEGAELLLIGSLNTLEENQSGVDVGGVVSSATSYFFDLPFSTEATEAKLSWDNAKVGMEIRLVDCRTSRVVAATTVEGTAAKVNVGAEKTEYTFNAGTLPKGFSIYHNTPIEEAFRKMLDAAVEFLAKKTPESYCHY